MSISFKELLNGTSIADVPIAHQHNLEDLLIKINVVRTIWAKPMLVSSGYRTWQDHCRIYKKNNPPAGSQHLIGCAVDIVDSKGELYSWLQDNPSILEAADLYCEQGTKGWVHFQVKPFKSYKQGEDRWFLP